MFYANLAIHRQNSKGPRGFTLVELLVVIAIIGILTTIVVPNVARYIRKTRITKAATEIRSAETALAGVLSDASISNFRDLLNPTGRQALAAIAAGVEAGNFNAILAAQGMYNEIFYEILRLGRNTNLKNSILDERVVSKLGSNYMDIGVDPWGNQYRFWFGPLRYPPLFRSYRPTDPLGNPFLYDGAAYAAEQARLPGNPQPDAQFQPFGAQLFGFPAPLNLPVYIYSLGPNKTVDAYHAIQQIYGIDPDFLGGGDDPNNWDKERGWESAPE